MIQFKKLFKIIILFFAIISLYAFYEHSSKSLVTQREIIQARHHLISLSKKEEKALRTLIHYVNIWCQFPYTLLQAKPMSIAGIVTSFDALPTRMKQYYAEKQQLQEVYLEGYYILRKIIEEKSSQFTLILFENTHCKGTSFIGLIHIPSCQKVLMQHKHLFQQILGELISPEEMYLALMTDNNPIQKKLLNNEHSLGTLLGFGVENAELYAKKQRFRLKNFNDEIFLTIKKWRLPGFLCDPNSNETKCLKKLYQKTQTEIFWTYLGYDEATITLALLFR